MKINVNTPVINNYALKVTMAVTGILRSVISVFLETKYFIYSCLTALHVRV